ncbi:MAG: SpoIIE family protein phosphatase [Bacteroidota bacterium]
MDATSHRLRALRLPLPQLVPTLSLSSLRAPLATPTRRVAAWTLAHIALAVAILAGVGFAIVGTPPTTGSRFLMDAAAICAIGLGYVLRLDARRRNKHETDPLRAFWEPMLFAIGLVAAESGLGMLATGRALPDSLLPVGIPTTVVSALLTVAEVVLVVELMVRLRPLVLYRRRRGAVVLWRIMLVWGALAAPFYWTESSSLSGTPAIIVGVLLEGVPVLLAVGLAFRQGWVGALSFRERLVAAGLALGLMGTLITVLYLRLEGPAAVSLDGGKTAVVAYSALLVRSVNELFLLTASFGILYSLTAFLVLVFQLPTSDALGQRAGERKALQTLADISGRVLDRDELAQAIARGPVDAGLADAAWLALPDLKSGSLTPSVVAAAGLTPSTAGRVADIAALTDAAHDASSSEDRSSGALVLAQASADHRVRANPGDGVGSLAVFPLAAGGHANGALVVSRRATESFETDDLASLQAFAAQSALALSHSDLFAEALERERLARELALAREVQERLLPQTLPVIQGLDLAATEHPAREVGGDYFDAVALSDDCAGVLVADVSGKGAAAAFYMAEMKGIFQAGSRLTRSPGAFLAQANEALSPSLQRGAFVSATYAVIDAEAGTIALARAGHCPAILARDADREDGGRWLLRGDGLAIGLDRRGMLFRQTLREQTVQLAPGDALILFTDGLVEARNAAGEEYGYDRLADAVARYRCTRAGTLRDNVLNDVRQWVGDREFDDDVTLFVITWPGRGDVLPAPSLPPVHDRPAFA